LIGPTGSTCAHSNICGFNDLPETRGIAADGKTG
jgi:hypothetical protein